MVSKTKTGFCITPFPLNGQHTMMIPPFFAVKDFPATFHIHSGNATKVWDVIEEIQSNCFLSFFICEYLHAKN